MNPAVLVIVLAFGWVWAQEDTRVPEEPDNLRVFTRFDGATAVAELIWKDNSESELGFEILRSADGEGFQVMALVGTNTDHYNDKIGKYVTGVYSYKVRAFNEVGKSRDSNTVTLWF